MRKFLSAVSPVDLVGLYYRQGCIIHLYEINMGKHWEVLFLGLLGARVIHHSLSSRVDLREIADSVSYIQRHLWQFEKAILRYFIQMKPSSPGLKHQCYCLPPPTPLPPHLSQDIKHTLSRFLGLCSLSTCIKSKCPLPGDITSSFISHPLLSPKQFIWKNQVQERKKHFHEN